MIQLQRVLLRDMVMQSEQENTPYDSIVNMIRRINTPSAQVFGYDPDHMEQVGDNNTFEEVVSKYGDRICYVQVVNFIPKYDELFWYDHLRGYDLAEIDAKSEAIDILAKYTTIKHVIMTGTDLGMRINSKEFMNRHLSEDHANLDITVDNELPGYKILNMIKNQTDGKYAIMMDDIHDSANPCYSKMNKAGDAISIQPRDMMGCWAAHEGAMLVGVENVVVPENYQIPNICRAMIRK